MRAEPGIAGDVVDAVRRGLAQLGFDAGQLDAVGTIVPGDAANRLFQHAADALDDPTIGLTLAPYAPIGSLGPIDYGMCTSATLGEALRFLCRYYGTVSQRVRLALEDDGGTSVLRFTQSPGMAHSRHWLEFSMAVIALRMSQTSGVDVDFVRVTFAHARPAWQETYDAFFRTPVEFAAPGNALVLGSHWLTRPLLTGSRALAEVLDRKLRELEPMTSDALLERARQTLVAMLDEGATDITVLARRMGTSKRTLQRELARRATSHTKLLDDLRRKRASELLDQGLRAADVAARLGFAEPSAFFRAYRRWTGTSPRGDKR